MRALKLSANRHHVLVRDAFAILAPLPTYPHRLIAPCDLVRGPRTPCGFSIGATAGHLDWECRQIRRIHRKPRNEPRSTRFHIPIARNLRRVSMMPPLRGV
jgi:hypothetical protein